MFITRSTTFEFDNKNLKRNYTFQPISKEDLVVRLIGARCDIMFPLQRCGVPLLRVMLSCFSITVYLGQFLITAGLLTQCVMSEKHCGGGIISLIVSVSAGVTDSAVLLLYY